MSGELCRQIPTGVSGPTPRFSQIVRQLIRPLIQFAITKRALLLLHGDRFRCALHLPLH